MPRLNISLQEGFANDAVEISVDGAVVFPRQNVTTRLQIGLAKTHEVEIRSESATVTIRLPERGLTREVPIDLRQGTYLQINLSRQGTIETRLSSDPPRYM